MYKDNYLLENLRQLSTKRELTKKKTKHLIFINFGMKKFIEKNIRIFFKITKITLMFERHCPLNSMK
jgi:hypothetical protein